MKLIQFAFLALIPSCAFSQQTYLMCAPLTIPSYQNWDSPEQRDAFIKDAIMQGQVGYIISPADTWIIDLEKGEISSPDENEFSTVRNLKVTKGSIRGTTEIGNAFFLNRISLKLSYTRFLNQKGVTIQNIQLPQSSTWTFQCKATKAPAA